VIAKVVEEIANAVLYEGYMLYPYRPSSVKNRQRWNFGVLYPKAYSQAQNGNDGCFMQTECLASGGASAGVNIKVRFLQAVTRTVARADTERDASTTETDGIQGSDFSAVQSLEVDGRIFQAWQEAMECEIALRMFCIGDQEFARQSSSHSFPGGREVEPVRSADGKVSGIIVRTKESISTEIGVGVTRLEDELYKITVRISNTSAAAAPTSDFEHRDASDRDDALKQSLLSAHTILTIEGGEFVSLIDPGAALKDFAAGCQNVGTWPVLAGEEGQRNSLLSSPIILYDYPQIAPESPGDLFDGCEIDEILALRILTLTEDEKKEMRDADERSRQILERTESMPAEHFMKLHGVLRGLRPSDEERHE
jgi:hydrogenase maturation protease